MYGQANVPPSPPLHSQQGSPAAAPNVVQQAVSDSDMEMEDDITLSDANHDSSDALDCKFDVSHGELDVKKHRHAAKISPGWSAPEGVSSEKVLPSLSESQLIIEEAPSRVDIYSTGASESPVASEKDNALIPRADDQKKLNASAAAEAINSEAFSNQTTTVNSPFRLLQDYASETSSENDPPAFSEDGTAVGAPSVVTTSVKSSHKDAGSQFEIGFKSPLTTDIMSGLQYESRRSKFSLDTKKEVRATDTTLIIESREAFQGKDALNGASIEITKRDKSPGGKQTKTESVLPKVDEYGRFVREGSSDSNSDGSRYNKRRRRGRSRSRNRSRSRSRIRSRSRSQSPFGSRRRWRSPQRRREKRNRSPRNQRSRSRSPTFRRSGEFRDENKRQDRRNIPECFDFLRGRCARGASCRYMHKEHDRNDGSWRHRSKQKHLELQPTVKNSRIKEEIEDSSDMNLHGEFKGQEMQIYPNMVPKDGQFINLVKTACENSTVTASTMQVKQILPVKSEEPVADYPESHHLSAQKLTCVDTMKSRGDTSQAIEQSRSNNSAGQGQKADYPPQQVEAFQSRPNESSNAQPLSSGQFLSQFSAPTDSSLSCFSAANSPYPSQLPPPPPVPPVSQGTSVAHVPQFHRDYNQRPPYPVQSIPTGMIHGYQGPLSNQSAQFSVSQDSTWTSLPPPPPRPPYPSLNAGTAAQGASQFQQNHLASRTDFGSQNSVRPYSSYGSLNPSNQPFGGPGHIREDRFTHAPVQDINSLRSFAQGHLHPQPAPASQDSMKSQMQNFSADNFPSGELPNASSQIHPHSHNQQPGYGVQYSVGDSMLAMPGKTGVQYPVGGSTLVLPGKDGPMSQYPQNMPDRSQLSQIPDFGASRIQTHHNPYAATFEQPSGLKFGSNIPIQEKNVPAANMFDTPVQVPVDGQGVGSAGSRQITSSPSSSGAVRQLLQSSVSGKYDPLFDSIEPSGNLLYNHDQIQRHTATNDLNMMVRFGGSCEPLDVEENKKHTEVGPVASTTSLDNDGFGETADADVDVMEDESLSNDDGGSNLAVGEREIDQMKSGGKSKKKKDSRSTRLFKSAVADFVKDLLKPSWRQGNMSKEAFKTIVKKTVDKVSGAMKSHQIPKSEAKINHYIDSSQRKLTKLVMGYVDKYVKV